jgi:predicted dehydrogenase
MRFFVIGLGSMGKRRVRNLISLGYHDIVGYDIRKDRMKEAKRKYGIKIVESAFLGFSENPDLVIISTWPNQHLIYAKESVKRKMPFFTEVNTEPSHIKQIIKLIKKYKVLGISSMTMKFHPSVKLIKKTLDSKTLGQVFLINYHSGENLEDWHPWEKLSDYYVGDIKTGGGRDQAVFELEWMVWLFGKPLEIMAKTSKLSKMDAKIFDTYQMTLTHKDSLISNILVDVIQRPPNRILRIVCEHGLIEWNWIQGLVRIFDSRKKTWKEYATGDGYKGFNVEEMYQNEIFEVIKSLKKNTNLVHRFEDELISSELTLLAEQSSKNKKTLKFK